MEELARLSQFARETTNDLPQLRVLLFGEPYVTYSDGGITDIPMPPRCLLLFAFLILHPTTRRRDRIAASLWPDVSNREARANLRRALHDLVHVLPKVNEPWIFIDVTHISLNPSAPLWCDAQTFMRFVSDERLRGTAIGLYSGSLLEGEDAEWIVASRAALHERQLEALSEHAEAALARGDTPSAASAYRRLLDLDPFREDAFRSLLRMHFARADRARAANAYQLFALKLRAELGVEPMPETVACYERIRRGVSPERESVLA